MGRMEEIGQALPEGTIILGGRYRLVQLLHQRPRVNLYLGRRLSRQDDRAQSADEVEPLVAIRELVLTGLSPETQAHIEQAAFEEFVSPFVPGSSRLTGAGDRVRTEGERHYLVTQLHSMKGEQRAFVITLAALLLSRKSWPSWLDRETALGWGIQLCRIVARLHRSGVVLGDLDPSTVLVDGEGATAWAPVLLVSWPPAPSFWPKSTMDISATVQFNLIFPIARMSTDSAFAAPETYDGLCDERSDVYSLGAILYLLFTRYAPSTATRRLQAVPSYSYERGSVGADKAGGLRNAEGLSFILPHLLNADVTSSIERVLLKALALDPTERYDSAFAFAEALEEVELS
jgi:hypothetical protein